MSNSLSNLNSSFKVLFKDYNWDLLFSPWTLEKGELFYDQKIFIINPKIERIPKVLILSYK